MVSDDCHYTCVRKTLIGLPKGVADVHRKYVSNHLKLYYFLYYTKFAYIFLEGTILLHIHVTWDLCVFILRL